jgi:putative polyketide hydroxylase
VDTPPTPVLIVGAGLAGLSTALFLGVHGVASLVVERHPSTSLEPKARGQMPATMEALRVAGVADAIAVAAPSGRPETTIVIAESLTGHVYKHISEQTPDFSRFSPAAVGMAGQERAEAILAARARELGSDIRFATRLESLTQDHDGVSATLRDLHTGEVYPQRAAYLIAADGHRGTVRELVGIGVHGRGAIGESTSIVFEADLDLALDGAAVQMHYLTNPALPGGSGVFVSTDTPGTYVAGMQNTGALTDEQAAYWVRVITGIPELQVRVIQLAGWSSACWVADRFSTGRVHLVGDAAHVMPPTGGQGGNTAIMDGYHVAWKLAAVLGGTAGPRLLDSHDIERRPYAEFLVEQQYAYLVQRQAPHLADATVPDIIEPARALFGYVHTAGAFTPDAADTTDITSFEDPAAPSERPGSRAPHVTLADGTSTRDLYGRDFVLLSAEESARTAASTAARRFGVTLTAHPIAPLHGGALLIRPDGLIGWRSTVPVATATIEDALREILDISPTSPGPNG